MQIDDDEAQVERVARELAIWHGSAMSHSNRDGEMQTVASSYVGHRWAHASTDYANKKWKQYRGAARCALAMVAAEREACAKIADAFRWDDPTADGTMYRDDDHAMDGTAHDIATKIRARSNPSD